MGTPITAFQRTALSDIELGDVPIKQGQRLALFYRSANFDEDVFDDPFSFNVLRDPNPHMSFGGTGAHYCLGANLARLTIELMFNAIADIVPDLTALADPERLRSGWLNGIKHWQVDYTGTCPVAQSAGGLAPASPETGGSGNLLGGMPLAGGPGLGAAHAGPRYGFRPTVMARPPFAG